MRAAVVTGSESIMRQRTTKVVDRAAVDVLVGRADGEAGFKRVDFQVTPMHGGGLHIDVEVPGQLAEPVRQFIAALGVKTR
jgi:hypothetical protein